MVLIKDLPGIPKGTVGEEREDRWVFKGRMCHYAIHKDLIDKEWFERPPVYQIVITGLKDRKTHKKLVLNLSEEKYIEFFEYASDWR